MIVVILKTDNNLKKDKVKKNRQRVWITFKSNTLKTAVIKSLTPAKF